MEPGIEATACACELLYVYVMSIQGAYKSGKMKFPEFSMFSRPSKQSFPDKYKVKTQCNKSP